MIICWKSLEHAYRLLDVSVLVMTKRYLAFPLALVPVAQVLSDKRSDTRSSLDKPVLPE